MSCSCWSEWTKHKLEVILTQCSPSFCKPSPLPFLFSPCFLFLPSLTPLSPSLRVPWQIRPFPVIATATFAPEGCLKSQAFLGKRFQQGPDLRYLWRTNWKGGIFWVNETLWDFKPNFNSMREDWDSIKFNSITEDWDSIKFNLLTEDWASIKFDSMTENWDK